MLSLKHEQYVALSVYSAEFLFQDLVSPHLFALESADENSMICVLLSVVCFGGGIGTGQTWLLNFFLFFFSCRPSFSTYTTLSFRQFNGG